MRKESREDFYREEVGRLRLSLRLSRTSTSNPTGEMAEIVKIRRDWKSNPECVKFVNALQELDGNLWIPGGITWLTLLYNMYLADPEILAQVKKFLRDTGKFLGDTGEAILLVTDALSDADPRVVKVTLKGTTYILINDRNFREKLEKRGY